MQQTPRKLLSLRRLGKLDDLVRNYGRNNPDGWSYSQMPDEDRVPPSPRKEPKRR